MISKQNLIDATTKKSVVIERNFCSENATWKDIEYLYDLSKNSDDLMYSSFGTMVIRNSQSYIDIYKKLVEKVSEIHGGKLFGAMAIVHFINRNNNKLTNENSISLSKKFYNDNPHPWPSDMDITEDYARPSENFEPTIHSDDADGMFIQGDGSTLWKFYKDNEMIESHIINTGDLIYIPRGLFHSVESLNPRHSVSISFDNSNLIG